MIGDDLPRHIEGKDKWIVEWWINGKASYGVGFSAAEAMSLIDIMKRYSDKPPVLHLPGDTRYGGQHMSFEEHLMENALIECEHILRGEKDFNKARDDFLDNETNKYMGEKSHTNLYTVWAMADYVIYTWCDGQDIQKLLDVMTHDEIKARITEGMSE